MGPVSPARQFGRLPNKIQPPLLGVMNAERRLCPDTDLPGASGAAQLLHAVGVMAVRRRPGPKLLPLEENGCGPSTLISPT